MPRQHRHERKRNAQRQFGAALDVISGAQSQVQNPRNDFQVRGRGQARGQEPPPRRNGDDAANTRREECVPLVDRITRDAQPQEGCESQSARERKPAMGKRGRSDQSEQQPRKKARMNPTNEHTSAPEERLNEPVTEAITTKGGAQKANIDTNTLTTKSEEERRALRAQRFAPRTEPAKAAAVNGNIFMKDTDGNALAKESKGGRRAAPASNLAEAVTDTGTVFAAGNDVPKEKSGVTVVAKQGEDIDMISGSGMRKETATEAAANPKKPTEWHTPASKKPEDRKDPFVNAPTLKISHSSKANFGSAKRPMLETAGFEQHSRKKPRLQLDTNRLSTPQHNDTVSRTEPTTKKTPRTNAGRPMPDRRNYLNKVLQTPQVMINDEREEPVELFQEDKLDLFPYGSDNVPIMYSSSIEHSDSAELLTETSLYLRQEALALLRQRNWTSKDFGRQEVPKKGPTRIIDDCDLYLRNGKIYVATDRGLLLAADYFKRIRIPDTQPVRFNGLRPAWAKLAEAKRHYRRVEESCMLGDAEKSQGLLELISGTTVMVLERVIEHFEGEDVELAYGMCLDTGAKGWFPYDITCPMDWNRDPSTASETSNSPLEEIIDWTKFSYARLAAFAAAATQQTSPAQAIPRTTPQTTTPPITPAGTASAPVTIPGISIDVSKKGIAVEVSSLATPQQKREIQSEQTTEKVLVEVVDTLMESRTHEPEARTEHMTISVAAGPLSTPTKEEKPAAADSEQEVNTQEPPKEQHGVEEGPEDGPRHDSPQHSAKKDENVARNEAIAPANTVPEQAKPSTQKPVYTQRNYREADEDEVDYSDGEL